MNTINDVFVSLSLSIYILLWNKGRNSWSPLQMNWNDIPTKKFSNDNDTKSILGKRKQNNKKIFFYLQSSWSPLQRNFMITLKEHLFSNNNYGFNSFMISSQWRKVEMWPSSRIMSERHKDTGPSFEICH